MNLVTFCQDSKNVFETCWDSSAKEERMLRTLWMHKNGTSKLGKTSRQWLGKSSTPEPMTIRSLITIYNQYLRLGESVPSKSNTGLKHLSELSAIEFLSPHVFSCLLVSSRVSTTRTTSPRCSTGLEAMRTVRAQQHWWVAAAGAAAAAVPWAPKKPLKLDVRSESKCYTDIQRSFDMA